MRPPPMMITSALFFILPLWRNNACDSKQDFERINLSLALLLSNT
jgi:hypothetical protein